jgi:hypothetical protein
MNEFFTEQVLRLGNLQGAFYIARQNYTNNDSDNNTKELFHVLIIF